MAPQNQVKSVSLRGGQRCKAFLYWLCFPSLVCSHSLSLPETALPDKVAAQEPLPEAVLCGILVAFSLNSFDPWN